MRFPLAVLASLIVGAGAQAQTSPKMQSLADRWDGASPAGGLLADGNGNLFGLTSSGGGIGSGIVYRIGTDGSSFTNLHSFSGSDGRSPNGNLIRGVGGDLFGTTIAGGSEDSGTVFRIGSSGGNLTILHSFPAGNSAPGPWDSLLADGTGNLFGTTRGGGASSNGTIFRIGADGTGFTTLHSFSGSDGTHPLAALTTDGSGNLFGTTGFGPGGALGGTIFRIGADGTGFTTLHNFSPSTDGFFPNAELITDGDGNLFGTTGRGGAGGTFGGTIFRIGTDGSGFATLHSFSGSDGSAPSARLLLDGSNNLFGTASMGGANDGGTIFRIGTDGSGFTTLRNFSGSEGFPPRRNSDGRRPLGGLITDGSGNLFGTTGSGGIYGRGIIFRIGSDGSDFINMHSFSGFFIPEPGTWAMMIVGFGLVGTGLRIRRASSAVVPSEHPTIA